MFVHVFPTPRLTVRKIPSGVMLELKQEKEVDMTYEEISTGLTQASEVMDNAQRFARKGVEMARGRLRLLNIPHYLLAGLKRELQDYNTRTCKWK
jgi:hypothetical protein